jgi:hypothetical protein
MMIWDIEKNVRLKARHINDDDVDDEFSQG